MAKIKRFGVLKTASFMGLWGVAAGLISVIFMLILFSFFSSLFIQGDYLGDFENGNDHFNKGIYKLFVEYKNSVELKKTNARFEIQEGNPIHFTVADNRMYRLETDVNGKVARGNFNDTKNSTILENAFDSVFNSEKSAAIVFPE